MKKILLFLLICVCISTITFGQRNITINATSTTNGAWVFAAGTYTFTPSADNATIRNTDIQDRLLGTGSVAVAGNVVITTAGGGAQAGNVTESGVATITAATTSTTQLSFTINAAGNITISNAINLTPASSTAIRPGTNISFTSASGTISISAAITASGGDYSSATTATAGAGGSITLTATTGNILVGAITTIGGATTSTNNNPRTGGAGGDITLSAPAGNISVTGAQIVSGGSTNTGGSGTKTGGAGGDISFSGNTGITLTAGLTSNGGTGDVNGAEGNFNMNDGNSTVTAGGINDGQTAGVINGGILTKTGAGTFLMAGTNTYTGGTVISGGALSIGADANLGNAAGGITFSNGATLKTTGTFNSTARAIVLNAGGGTLNLTPSLTLTGAISGGGGLSTGGSDLILNRAAGNNAIGTININSNRVFVFTGLNNINGSTINVANGATLDFAFGSSSPTNTMVFASGACLANRSGTLTVSTANLTFPSTGTMIFNNDDLATTAIVVNGNYPTLTGNLDIQVGGGNATVGTTTLNGIVAGGFGINKTSTGILTLAGLNTYTGTTTVTAGTLKAGVATTGANGAFGNASAVTMASASGAILDITGFNNTIGSLTGGNATEHITLGAATLTIGSNNTSPAAFGGNIAGTGALTKIGTGTLTLSGLNTYTGITTISNGTVSINTLQNVSGGASSLGAPTSVANGTISIAGTGILQYTGAGSTSDRAFTLTGSGATLDASGSGAFNLSGGGIGGATFGLNLTGNSVGILSGVIATTSGTLTKNGTGTWSLFGLNTYTGKTTINTGALNITTIQNVSGGASSLGAPTSVANGTIDLGGTATLRYSGAGNTSNRVINLTGSGATIDAATAAGLILNGNITGTNTNLVITITGVGSCTVAGAINTGAASVTHTLGTLNVNGTNTFTGGFIQNSGALNINNSSALGTVASTFTFNGGLINNTSGGPITTNNHPIIINYYDLVFTGTNSLNLGTGTLTLNDANLDITVNANTLTYGGAFDLGLKSLAKYGPGTLSFGSNGVVMYSLSINAGTLISTSANLVLKNAFGNNATFNHNNGTVTFNSASTLVIGGSVVTTFNNATINSTTGVQLNQDATINGVLSFVAGKFSSITSNMLTLGSAASATGANSSTYVNGPMKKIGNTTFEFPVGNATLYRPIEVSALSASSTIRAEYFAANPHTAFGNTVSGGLNQVSACEYWTLTEPVGINGIVKLNFGGSCNAVPYVTDASALRVAHWSGAQWDNLGNDGSATLTSVKATIGSTFSPFTIGTTNGDLNPLPVKISSIRAYEKTNGIQIDWTAYNEDKLLNYIVERSANGVDFVAIGSVAARNQPGDQRYGFFDATPLPGVNFYRLKNVDLDSKFGYSNIVKINLDKNDHTITLYPNPVRNGIVSFQSSNLAKGTYDVKLFNAAGQQVYAQKISHTGGAINQTIQLPAGARSGMYSLQLDHDGEKLISKTFIVQ